MIEKHLYALGFSAEEVRLYLDLWQQGPAAAGRIAQRCGIRRSSLYGVLDRLVQKGIVRCEEPGGVRRYHAEPPGVFQEMFARRQRHLAEAQESFHELLPKLYKKSRSDVSTPRLTLYQGKAQLQNILGDMLLYHDIETWSLWPVSLMTEILSPESSAQHSPHQTSPLYQGDLARKICDRSQQKSLAWRRTWIFARNTRGARFSGFYDGLLDLWSPSGRSFFRAGMFWLRSRKSGIREHDASAAYGYLGSKPSPRCFP